MAIDCDPCNEYRTDFDKDMVITGSFAKDVTLKVEMENDTDGEVAAFCSAMAARFIDEIFTVSLNVNMSNSEIKSRVEFFNTGAVTSAIKMLTCCAAVDNIGTTLI